MKKIYPTFCVLMLWLAGTAQVPGGSYKTYTGRIGEVEATLHLTMAGKKVGGWIWFNRTPRPMPLYAEDWGADSLRVSAAASPINVTLTGILSAGAFVGRSELQKEGSPSKNAGFKLQLSTDTLFTPLDYMFAQGSAAMPPKAENESTAEYFAASVWPKGNAVKPFAKTVRHVVNRELANKAAPQEPGKLLLTEKNKFLTGWKADMAKLSPKQAKEMGHSNSQQIENKIEVMYEDADVIALAHYNYVFSGGAHGNYGTTVVNIYKRTGAILQLKDVLTEEGMKAMPKILETVIRQQYGLDKNKSLEGNGLFVNTLAPSDNFYITNGNLGFLYMPYAIMAYVYGEPNIYIPSSIIAPYLRPAFKK